MQKKRFPFMGTVIAIAAILIMVLIYKLCFNEPLEQKVVIYEPTEGETLKFLPDTELVNLPTE